MYQLIDTSGQVIFEIDCEDSEQFDLAIDWTDKPIETGEDIAKHGITKPDNFAISGMITASPLGQPMSDHFVIDAIQALEDLAKKKQPVTAWMGYFARGDVVIKGVSARAGGDVSGALDVQIGLKQIKTTTPEATTMPAARMKPRVKKRSAPTKKGGSANGEAAQKAAKARAKSMALRGAQALAGIFT